MQKCSVSQEANLYDSTGRGAATVWRYGEGPVRGSHKTVMKLSEGQTQ